MAKLHCFVRQHLGLLDRKCVLHCSMISQIFLFKEQVTFLQFTGSQVKWELSKPATWDPDQITIWRMETREPHKLFRSRLKSSNMEPKMFAKLACNLPPCFSLPYISDYFLAVIKLGFCVSETTVKFYLREVYQKITVMLRLFHFINFLLLSLFFFCVLKRVSEILYN